MWLVMAELALEPRTSDSRHHWTSKDTISGKPLPLPPARTPASSPRSPPPPSSVSLWLTGQDHCSKCLHPHVPNVRGKHQVLTAGLPGNSQVSFLFLNLCPGNPSHLDFYPITWVPQHRAKKGYLKWYKGTEKRKFLSNKFPKLFYFI